jgi:hypothetical protein
MDSSPEAAPRCQREHGPEGQFDGGLASVGRRAFECPVPYLDDGVFASLKCRRGAAAVSREVTGREHLWLTPMDPPPEPLPHR